VTEILIHTLNLPITIPVAFNAKNKDGQKALMVASSNGHQEVVNSLKAHGAHE
jgi:ankyrin repeat protein